MKSFKLYFKPLFLSGIIFVPLTALLVINREWSWYTAAIISLLYFFIITIFINKEKLKLKDKIINIILFLLPLFGLASFYLWRGPDSFITTPFYVINPVIGILLGFAYLSVKKRYLKITTIIATFCLIFLLTHTILTNWMDYFVYGSWTGYTSEEISEFKLKASGRTLTKKDFYNSIVVLEFWNTSCSKCISQFSELQKISDNFKSTGVKVYAVNVPLKTDTAGQAVNILNAGGYSFENLQGYSPDSTYRAFKVFSFPTALVLDKSGRVIYRGNPKKIDDILDRRL